MAIDPRKQVFTQYYFPQRKDMGARIKGYSNKQAMGGDMGGDMGGFPDYKQAAMALYGAGMKADAQGNMVPTQDFGAMTRMESQGINSLSRGTPGGFSSSLGKPPGSMYAQDPTAFKNMQNPYYRAAQGGAMNMPSNADFGQAVAQRNEGSPSGFTMPGYTVGQSGGAASNQPSQTSAYQGPYRPGFSGVSEQQKTQNRAALQEQVDAKRMLGQATGGIPTVSNIPDMSGKTGGTVAISGKYGSGSSTFSAPGTPRKEGLIEGKPASQVLQALANKPGIARAGDRFQPQKSTPAESAAMNKTSSKFPLKNPLVKNK
jgi:hypothetical protein